MKKRTQEEIDRQIDGLKKMKQKFPEFSSFGDKNWEKIDAQLDVLEGRKEPDEFYVDETSDDYQDGDNDVFFDAEKADRWLYEGEEDDLFE